MSGSTRNPFSLRGVLLLVLFGAVVFVALLWMIGTGMGGGQANDGGSHVGGKGLNGYAALADYLERRGHTVRRSRNEGALDDEGLLVLTPPQWADGEELEKIVSARRFVGPTLVIAPKWIAAKAPDSAKGAKPGWVYLAGTQAPSWRGFLDDLTVTIAPLGSGKAGGWRARGLSGRLPDVKTVLSGSGQRLAPLVVAGPEGRVLAGYIADDGDYPGLDGMTLGNRRAHGGNTDVYPLVIVFEPDLLDNYGMADKANAVLAERLFDAAGEYGGDTIIFDMTLNGHGASANLLTLAFTPPFIAATICLILAGIAVGWRAFLRFGPPRKAGRAIAFGKRALVANTAGLVRRTRRFHLVSPPYVARARRRLAAALGLPRDAGTAETDAAIDCALAARSPGSTPFSTTCARLAAAHRPHDLLKAAQDLYALERTLTR